MYGYLPRSLVAGLLLAVGTTAMAGSVSAPLAVSATVVANCRPQGAPAVCTKGSASPRTEAVTITVSESGPSGITTVTVNY